MVDPISRLLVITEIDNAIIRHEPKEGDSELIKAYEEGYKDACESMKMLIEKIGKDMAKPRQAKRRKKEAKKND